MNCLNCKEEMVDAEVGVIAESSGNIIAWPRGTPEKVPWYKLAPLLPKVRTTVGRPTKVCPQCGLLLLFVEDPAVFRPGYTRSMTTR